MPPVPATLEPGFASDDYPVVQVPVPHHERGRAILVAHPEARALFGRNVWTAAWTVVVVAAHLGLAFVLHDAPWWAVIPVAWCVGALLAHDLFILLHEAGHGLVFRSPAANHLLVLFANLPHAVPSGESFNRYHLRHHAFRGVYEEDGDLADRWEARLYGRSFLGKLVWQFTYWFHQAFRSARLARSAGIPWADGWVVANLIVGFGFDAWVYATFGPMPLLYLFVSLVFSIGPHPLGARWIQEHFVVFPGQETASYYGPGNRLTFNAGYHNEHHDLPGIPWNRLPALRRLAPEMYDGLGAHHSWTRLWWRFLSDPELSLFSRVTRPKAVARPEREVVAV
jgi:sphingolipid delta-4 desaturase